MAPEMQFKLESWCPSVNSKEIKQKNTKEKQLMQSKEHCYHGDGSQNKTLAFKKCFVHPLVDLIEHAKFKVLNVIR